MKKPWTLATSNATSNVIHESENVIQIKNAIYHVLVRISLLKQVRNE